MSVCLSVVSVVCCQVALRRADHSFRGVLQAVMRRCARSRNLMNEEADQVGCWMPHSFQWWSSLQRENFC